VLFALRRRISHPFYPAIKPAPAVSATGFPEALSGAVIDLLLAARTGVRPAHAVFPLLSPSSPFLDESDRETLWEIFQVPVYALLVDGRDDVVGYECEAQDGLHLRKDYAARLLFGRIESALCECGRPGPRLIAETPTPAAALRCEVVVDSKP